MRTPISGRELVIGLVPPPLKWTLHLRSEEQLRFEWGWDGGPLLLAVGFVKVKRGSGVPTPCNRLAEARVTAKEVAKFFFGMSNF